LYSSKVISRCLSLCIHRSLKQPNGFWCGFFNRVIKEIDFYVYNMYNIDGRWGVVVGILAYYARGRGFDSRTVQKFVCMSMSVCIGSGCFYVYKYVFIRLCYKIHNTSLISAYFGLDSRECKCKKISKWKLHVLNTTKQMFWEGYDK
jgi:hypothetical protein